VATRLCTVRGDVTELFTNTTVCPAGHDGKADNTTPGTVTLALCGVATSQRLTEASTTTAASAQL
jgi:hypothetical protein